MFATWLMRSRSNCFEWVMLIRNILIQVFVMVSHVYTYIIFNLNVCLNALQLLCSLQTNIMNESVRRLCKWRPIDNFRPKEICGIILRHVCLFSQVQTWSTLGWSQRCHTMMHRWNISFSPALKLTCQIVIHIVEHQI